MGSPWRLAKGKAFAVMVDGCNSWCPFFHMGGKQEFTWKQDSNGVNQVLTNIKSGRWEETG